MTKHPDVGKGPVSWMARHTVASNLLMLLVIIGGIMAAFSMKQEVFPEFSTDTISISIPYPGASPKEVEQGIILIVEEKVRGINGVKSITSTAKEGSGSIIIEVLLGEDANEVLADVKNEVDRISNFPAEAEAPTVSLIQPKNEVISLMIAGDEDLKVLHGLAERARREMLADKNVTQVDMLGVPNLEVEVALKRETLESMGLSVQEVANQIRMASIELGGGSLDTKKGKLLVRVADRKLSQDDFSSIPIKAGASGTEIPLSEIAEIRDGYEDTDLAYYFNGKRTVQLKISRVGNQTPTDVADAVKAYAKGFRNETPNHIEITTWDDRSLLLQDRIDLLVRNAATGLVLVLIILALFLERRLAFWVGLGIPISFLGAFMVMGWANISINMMTLFALIITLGMVVDDAIVVAENVFEKMQHGLDPLQAAVEGTKEMVGPVTFSILTTITAFSPLLFVPGVMGKIFAFIPSVVIAVLFISLVECYFILPAHLSHGAGKDFTNPLLRWINPIMHFIDNTQTHANAWLQNVINTRYKSFLEKALDNKHLTMSVSTGILIVVIATVPAGIIPFNFFPKVEGDIITANLKMPYGVTMETTENAYDLLVAAEKKAAKHFGEDKVLRQFVMIGQSAAAMGPHGGGATGTHLLGMSVELVPSDDREFSAEEYSVKWKEFLGVIPGMESLTIGSTSGPSSGKGLDLQLSHFDTRILAKASEELAAEFSKYPALMDIENTYSAGKPQLDFRLKEGAKALGISANDVAFAIRSSFFGSEALREQRGRNEVKVMVRLAEEQRDSEADLENLLIKTRAGAWVRLGEVTEFIYSEAPTEIKREDGQRVVNVSAEIIPTMSTSAEMNRTLYNGKQQEDEEKKDKGNAMGKEGVETQNGFIPKLVNKYPGLEIGKSGMQESQAESIGSLKPNYILALIVIFALLAIPFRSYTQPLIVMSAIPFGIVGALIGHLIMGETLTIISIMGIIALSGVVVNDSLVYVNAVNKYRAQGVSIREALIKGGIRRFRPILMTSLTTFFGLLPMIFETSMQAKFLIPMAISLGFGALFVTAIVLIMVPALYLIVQQIQQSLGLHADEEEMEELLHPSDELTAPEVGNA